MSDKPKIIRVRPVPNPNVSEDLLLLDDQNDDHPGGYVQIRLNSKVTEVADVPRVRELIGNGVLEVVEPKAAPQP